MATLGGLIAGGVPAIVSQPTQAVPTPQEQNAPGGEFEQKKSAWNQFLQRLAEDEALRTGLLQAGAQLLQPRTGGQSQAGAIGAAAVSGVEKMSEVRQRQRSEEQQERENALRERQVSAQEDLARAQSERTRFETQRGRARLPGELDAQEQDLDLRDAQIGAIRETILASRTGREVDEVKLRQLAENADLNRDVLRAQADQLMARAEALRATTQGGGQTSQTGQLQVANAVLNSWIASGNIPAERKAEFVDEALVWAGALSKTENPEALRAKLTGSLIEMSALGAFDEEAIANTHVMIDELVKRAEQSQSRALTPPRAGSRTPPPQGAVPDQSTLGPSGLGTSRDNPLRPQTVEEFQQVKSGQWYINPGDGQAYQKQ